MQQEMSESNSPYTRVPFLARVPAHLQTAFRVVRIPLPPLADSARLFGKPFGRAARTRSNQAQGLGCEGAAPRAQNAFARHRSEFLFSNFDFPIRRAPQTVRYAIRACPPIPDAARAPPSDRPESLCRSTYPSFSPVPFRDTRSARHWRGCSRARSS